MPSFYPPRLEARWEMVAMRAAGPELRPGPAAWSMRCQYNQLHPEGPL
ncbi:hypothetical protein [Micromonospora sp. 050-3]